MEKGKQIFLTILTLLLQNHEFQKKTVLVTGVLCLALSFCLFATPMTTPSRSPRVEEGTEKYLEGEKAGTPEERQKLFNEALSIYLAYAKDHPSGMLLNNIGNVYFYLGDLGTAICYYRRATVLMPRDSIIQKNLRVALAQADVTHLQQPRPLFDALALRWCSPFERAALSIGLIASTFIFFTLNLWLPSLGFLWLWRASAILTLALLWALVWYALFVSPQAVVIKAAPLRASSDTSFSGPSVTTVIPGEVVEVLDTDASHHWARVKTASQTTGYLPGQDLCFIEGL
jgi:tetratricopeptide (TPR) repeat protein